MSEPIELLAPAGDRERLEAALRFGADAVYAGGPMLQLRAQSAGFALPDLADAAETVHAAGKRLYITVNSVAKNAEIDRLPDYARALREAGADAVIVSDLGALRTIKKAVPELELHISTQANCLNYAAATQYYELGASRVILGREASLEEIAELRARTPKALQLECFVHGAMCMAYSGRCLLSAYMNHRSGNRGECAQPCRYRYVLSTSGHEGDFYPIYEEDGATTILSSRDLNAMPFLEKLIEVGVTSLKIEGRMKTAYYVATVVNAYRHALDGTASREACLKELDCASHRDYTSGFYFGEAKTGPAAGADYRRDCDFIAVVRGTVGGRYQLEQRNPFRIGDRLELLSPYSMGESFVLEDLQDEDGLAIPAAPHPMQHVSIACPLVLHPGDILRRRIR